MIKMASRLLEIAGFGHGSRRQLAVSAIGLVIVRFGSKAIGFASTVVLARILGAEGFGVYVFALAIVSFISMLGIPSLGPFFVQRVAAYRASKQWSLMRGLLRLGTMAGVILGGILAVCAAVIVWAIWGGQPSETLTTFLIALPMLPIAALLHQRSSGLRGLNHVVLGTIPPVIARPVFFIFVFVAIVLIGAREGSAPVAMVAQVVGTILAMLYAMHLLRQRLPLEVRDASPAYQTQQWTRGAVPFLLMGILLMINQQADALMLGTIQDARAVGVYRPAASIAMLITFGASAVAGAIHPTIAQRYEVGKVDTFQRLATYGARAGFAFAFVCASAAILLGDWILLIFGSDFVEGVTALAILSVGRIVYAALGEPTAFLDMTKLQSVSARGMAAGATVNIVLNLALIPPFGINGAAIATASGLVTWNLLLAIEVRRRLGVNTTIFGPTLFGLKSALSPRRPSA